MPISAMPESTPNTPASANITTLVVSSDQPARPMACGVAAGAAQHDAIGAAHQPEMHDERDDHRRDDRERHERRLQVP